MSTLFKMLRIPARAKNERRQPTSLLPTILCALVALFFVHLLDQHLSQQQRANTLTFNQAQADFGFYSGTLRNSSRLQVSVLSNSEAAPAHKVHF